MGPSVFHVRVSCLDIHLYLYIYIFIKEEM